MRDSVFPAGCSEPPPGAVSHDSHGGAQEGAASFGGGDEAAEADEAAADAEAAYKYANQAEESDVTALMRAADGNHADCIETLVKRSFRGSCSQSTCFWIIVR